MSSKTGLPVLPWNVLPKNMGGLGGQKKNWYDSKYYLIAFNLHKESFSLIYKLCEVIKKIYKLTSSHDFFLVTQIFYKYQ